MDKMNRRSFTGLSIMGLLAAAASMSGCVFANVFAQVSAYVGVGIQAVTSVVSLLAGAGIIAVPGGMLVSDVLGKIKAAWSDVTASVATYDSAPADQKNTVAQKVSLALTVVAQEIQGFWSDLNIPDAKMSQTVAGLLGLVVSTIAGFLASLPAPPAPAQAPRLRKALAVQPKRLSVKEFKKQFNAILAANGYSQHEIK